MGKVREGLHERLKDVWLKGLHSPQAKTAQPGEYQGLLLDKVCGAWAATLPFILAVAGVVRRAKKEAIDELRQSANKHAADAAGQVNGFQILALAPALQVFLFGVVRVRNDDVASSGRASASARRGPAQEKFLQHRERQGPVHVLRSAKH